MIITTAGEKFSLIIICKQAPNLLDVSLETNLEHCNKDEEIQIL